MIKLRNTANNKEVIISKGFVSDFSHWLVAYLNEDGGKFLDKFAYNAVMNQFDALEHGGCLFRAELQTFLAENKDQEITLVTV